VNAATQGRRSSRPSEHRTSLADSVAARLQIYQLCRHVLLNDVPLDVSADVVAFASPVVVTISNR
jgi:hypothetical protein